MVLLRVKGDGYVGLESVCERRVVCASCAGNYVENIQQFTVVGEGSISMIYPVSYVVLR